MADMVNVGIAGRVYVRFRADALDAGALEVFKRAGARHDRERNLWFVSEANRDAAVLAVVTTFGDLSGVPSATVCLAPGGGLTLACGWVLVAMSADWIEYRNPFASTPEAVHRVTISELHATLGTAPDAVRTALTELLVAANDLDTRSKPKPPPKPVDKKPHGSAEPATEKQRNALDVMLSRLARHDQDRADELRDELDDLGGFTLVTKADASKLIDTLAAELEEYK